MSAVIVIPARHASTRLPGKPLLKETGKYLIQHVYEQACQSRLARSVVVATDDPRIVAAVDRFGGQAMLTRRDHASGTDRVAEVARRIEGDIVVNLQGDEPLIDPTALDTLIARHGVQARRVAPEIMIALGNAAGAVMLEERERADALGKRVFESFLRMRKLAMALGRQGEPAIPFGDQRING